MVLTEWQKRVIEEKTELGEKVKKLKKYLDENSDYDDLLLIQLNIMSAYFNVLECRIEKF
jgi:hypothetical protein